MPVRLVAGSDDEEEMPHRARQQRDIRPPFNRYSNPDPDSPTGRWVRHRDGTREFFPDSTTRDREERRRPAERTRYEGANERALVLRPRRTEADVAPRARRESPERQRGSVDLSRAGGRGALVRPIRRQEPEAPPPEERRKRYIDTDRDRPAFVRSARHREAMPVEREREREREPVTARPRAREADVERPRREERKVQRDLAASMTPSRAGREARQRGLDTEQSELRRGERGVRRAERAERAEQGQLPRRERAERDQRADERALPSRQPRLNAGNGGMNNSTRAQAPAPPKPQQPDAAQKAGNFVKGEAKREGIGFMRREIFGALAGIGT